MNPSITPVACGIGLGSSTFGREIGPDEAFAVLDHAVARGVTCLDTAALYSSGEAERIVGIWLASRRPAAGSLMLATKIYPPYSAAAMTAALTASLGRLGVGAVDVLYLHKWDESAALPEALDTLDAFVRQGRVRAIGASNFTLDQLALVRHRQAERCVVRFTYLQNNHNLAVREADPAVRAFCAELGLAIVTYSPLGAGFLTGKHRAQVARGSRFDVSPGHKDVYFNEAAWRRLDRLEAVAARSGLSQAKLALAWAFHQAGVAQVVVGARHTAHIEQALDARQYYNPGLLAELEAD